MKEHVHDATVPVCSCGHRWEFVQRWKAGALYTSRVVRDRYLALYGSPEIPFEEVGGL
jgi:hypothetical protein